mmetsp:Transcript_11885/g.16353  ORF Transcript_11885/g.16353 Transcript_11885/m.16353 type:complete len:275 (+) Transcript_11885:157-981(+)
MKRIVIHSPIEGAFSVLFLVAFFYLLWKSGEFLPVAIVIPGGGLTKGGECPPHTKLRIEKAFSLYTEKKKLKRVVHIITLSGGTPYKPNPVDNNGFPIWEATAATKLLLSMGVPPEDIFEEAFSLDTIGNAYYLRMLHTEPSGIDKVIVVTNSWHMPRTKAIFDCVFNLRIPNRKGLRFLGDMKYVEVAAGIDDANVLLAREKKEKAALKQFKEKTMKEFGGSIESFHKWLYTKHNAYSAHRLISSSSDGDMKKQGDGEVTLSAEEKALLLKSY